jgi:type IV pilus assembly protein PilE
MRCPAAGRHRGFTLVECVVVCAMAAVLAAVALPALRNHTLRAGRLDAVQALTRVQAAQEQHRALHGLYADELGRLRGTAVRSTQGRYTLSLARNGPEAYVATATASGEQAGDRACPALTLEVNQGFPREGPSAACWQR